MVYYTWLYAVFHPWVVSVGGLSSKCPRTKWVPQCTGEADCLWWLWRLLELLWQWKTVSTYFLLWFCVGIIIETYSLCAHTNSPPHLRTCTIFFCVSEKTEWPDLEIQLPFSFSWRVGCTYVLCRNCPLYESTIHCAQYRTCPGCLRCVERVWRTPICVSALIVSFHVRMYICACQWVDYWLVFFQWWR
jgi:hypothetical protein